MCCNSNSISSFFFHAGINDDSSTTDSNRSAIFEFIPTVPVGSYKLRSISSGFFLAMDEKGKLYGEPDRNNEGTVFAEHAEVSFLLQKKPAFPEIIYFFI